MKKIVLLALAASTVAVATPASAQVTGTINLSGKVDAKCLVLPGSGATFGNTTATAINLGELAGTDGTLRTGIAADVNSNVAMTARVVCTSATPTISVDADALRTTAAAATGYDNSIDYNAKVVVTRVNGTTVDSITFNNDSSGSAQSSTAIGGRVANNGSDNIVITTNNFRTDNLTDLLVASQNYSGSIVIVISPGA